VQPASEPFVQRWWMISPRDGGFDAPVDERKRREPQPFACVQGVDAQPSHWGGMGAAIVQADIVYNDRTGVSASA
jgi:hypothetical protein